MTASSTIRRLSIMLFLGATGALLARPAGAATDYLEDLGISYGSLQFSEQSSDTTSPAVLTATVNFGVYQDGGNYLLQLDFHNDSGYIITELRFNVSSNITGLSNPTLSSDPPYDGYTPSLSQGGGAGGFGTFDWNFDFGDGNAGVAANTSTIVTFQIASSNPPQLSDFFDTTTQNGDKDPAFAIIHFQSGPRGDSAWGATADLTTVVLPVPSAAVLMGLGMVGVAFRRFRKR